MNLRLQNSCSLVIIDSKYFRNFVGGNSNRSFHTTRVGRSIDCWCNNIIHFTLSKLKGGHTNENSSQTVRQKENWSSGEEGYAGVASGLCRLDVSAEASLCTWEASARKTKISSILRWHGRFPVSTAKALCHFLCWWLRFRYEFSPSYYRNVDNIACWVYSVRKDGTMHKSKGVTPMQQYSFEWNSNLSI